MFLNNLQLHTHTHTFTSLLFLDLQSYDVSMNFILDLLSNKGEAGNLNVWLKESIIAGESIIDFEMICKEDSENGIHEECRNLSKTFSRYLTAVLLHHKELVPTAMNFAKVQPYEKDSNVAYKLVTCVWSISQQIVHSILKDYINTESILQTSEMKLFDLKSSISQMISNCRLLLSLTPVNKISLESMEEISIEENINSISSNSIKKVIKALKNWKVRFVLF